MSESEIAVILSKLEHINAKLEEVRVQTVRTNGRVTKLERVALVTFGVLVGAGLYNIDTLRALFLSGCWPPYSYSP